MAVTCTRDLTVIAKNATDGFYYRGIIRTGINGDVENLRVKFRDIKPQDVPVDDIICIGGAVPWPELQVRDCVLVRAPFKTNDAECYVPGRIIYLPADCRRQCKLYTVELYTQPLTIETRRYIVKISNEKYHEIVNYINTLHREHPELQVTGIPCTVHMPDNSSPEPGKDKEPKTPKITEPKPGERDVKPSLLHIGTGCTHYHHHKHYYQVFEKKSVRHQKDKGTQTKRPLPPKPETKPDTTPLKPGEDVLARWQDDGWYYFGKVVAHEEDGCVRVLDSTGYQERIKRENILVNKGSNRIQKSDKVVALHTGYVYSYAPATVLHVDAHVYHVKFYDAREAVLPGSEVYKISERKFKEDIEYITQKERELCRRVVARNDASGIYEQFIAIATDHKSREVIIQSADDTCRRQSALHVFPMDAVRGERENEQMWKYVIGPVDAERTIYLPAQIVCRRPFRLVFCNGIENDATLPRHCFHISGDYYRNAAVYFASKCIESKERAEI